MASVITHVTVESLLSDHHVIVCRLKLPKPRPARKQITYRKHGAIDNALFECDLLASSFVSAPVGNTQTQCEQYNHELSTIMDKHAPTIRQTINVRPRQPWRTDDLQSMRRDVRRAERKWRQTRLVVHRQIYTDVRDAFKKGIATAKSTYYCGQIESSANDARKMCRVAGDLMGCSRLPLAPNGDDSAVDLAERFSAHYVAKIIQLHSHLTVASVPSHPPLLADNDECSVAEPLYVFEPATVEAITKLSMDASSKVCPRIDVLTAVLLRSHMSTLAPVLTRLVNSSIESSTVPAAMKHATITPLLKKPGLDVDNMSSYRPISKLSFVSKVLEKHIAIQIQHHMETHNLFDTFQSAYRPHHSCETAIVRIQDDILKSLDSHKYVILVLLDLSSAFDSVDHDILMNKLYKIGLRGRAYSWVKSYLSSRTQAVEIGEAMSETVHLHCGVPQGSVLGPLLFNIYCLDLADVFRDHSVHYHMYADDTQLYVEFPNGPLEHSTSDAERMSRCITDVKTWLTEHKLALNDKKTEAIRITTMSTCHPRPAVIHVGALAVQSKPHVRDIGIVLDDTMTMAKHVSHTCRTAYYHLHNIASIRRSLTTSACKIIVHSLVISRLDFGNATLYGISDALLHILQVLSMGPAELCCTVDNRNPQKGAHFTSPVRSALVTHSPAHQIQAAGTRLSLSTPTCSCIPIRSYHTIHSG